MPHLPAGVARTTALDRGVMPPLDVVAVTLTAYCFAGARPVKVQRGEALRQVAVAVPLPPTSVAVKVYCVNGPPEGGGVAVAMPVVGPMATALLSVGALRLGMVSWAGAEAGVVDPSVRVAVAVRV